MNFLPEPQGHGSLRPTRPQVDGSFGSRDARPDPLPQRRAKPSAGPAPKAVALGQIELVLAGGGIEVLGEHGRQLLRLGLLEHHLDAHELAGHLLAQMADQVVEELEGLGLVLVQRIALGVAAPADDLTQVVEGDEVLAPEVVEALQQNLLLDIVHDLGRVRLDALGVGLVGGLADALADLLVGDALLLRPFLDRQVEVEEVDDVLLQARDVPLLGIGVLGDGAGRRCRR